MKYIIYILFILLTVSLQAQEFMPLWPSYKIPNSRGVYTRYTEERQRITEVEKPGIHMFLTSVEENTGAAVLICPPGGYQKLTYNLAGFQFAKWLNTIGINAFVLIYRLPNSEDLKEREKGPIQDAQRAMKLIRSHAEEWKINPDKIGVMGSSAGGHLASTIATHTQDFSNIGDAVDKFSFTPDFMVLISPVISMGDYTHMGSRRNFLGEDPTGEMIELYSNQLHVNMDTPPVFLVHAQNDRVVSPMNSMLFYQELIRNNVKATLHIFPEGEHSIALKNNPGSANLWTDLCEAWLREIKITDKN